MAILLDQSRPQFGAPSFHFKPWLWSRRPWVYFTGHLTVHPQISATGHEPFKPFLPSSLELRTLDLLEALHASLHLLRSRIVSPLGVLVDVQLVVLALACVLSLYHILPQDLRDRLYMLDRIVCLF